jgi:hypothetical protein
MEMNMDDVLLNAKSVAAIAIHIKRVVVFRLTVFIFRSIADERHCLCQAAAAAAAAAAALYVVQSCINASFYTVINVY